MKLIPTILFFIILTVKISKQFYFVYLCYCYLHFRNSIKIIVVPIAIVSKYCYFAEYYTSPYGCNTRTSHFILFIQTGTGNLNGIQVVIRIMDFQFMGGNMGSTIGEKITHLVEYVINQLLPLILVCAS